MLSRTSEKRMRAAQIVMFLGWLVLITSLVWDPFSANLTLPQNTASPFHIRDATVLVQGKPMLNEPYPMSARLWWALILPILPLCFMVFGHEAWRRVCPLSFASQLPRYLNLQRRRSVLHRSSGKLETALVLVRRNGWLHRNAWYVQFGLLVLGLTLRLLLINADRTALAVFFAAVIVCAITVGYLWGGKTWCNYFCPVNVVQKIYTEPRGLLESSPHTMMIPISQSSCRSMKPQGERSACVGCMPNCGDIDLERSYWETIYEPKRRHVYYMFPGLVFAFYFHYYIYAGNWDYYFSGIWTHESNLAGKLLEPGIFLFGRTIPIPKLLTAPLTLMLGALIGLGLGLFLEKTYRWLRTITNRPVGEAELLNHCLSFSAYLSINIFYLFGGRPNIQLLYAPAIHALDILIIGASTLWFWQVMKRSPRRYRRESLASSLLEQLRQMKVDFSRYLDGRRLEDLKPDEIYMLTEVLPAISSAQKLQAYKKVLDDAITTGKTRSALSLQLLHEMRAQMNISEEEHNQLLAELDVAAPVNLDVQAALAQERGACVSSYAEIVGSALANQIESGRTLESLLMDPQIAGTVSVMRASFQITDVEHEATLRRLTETAGLLFMRAVGNLRALKDICGARFCMQGLAFRDTRWGPFAEFLIGVANLRAQRVSERLLSLMRAFGDSGQTRWIAYNTGVLMGEHMNAVLDRPVAGNTEVTWREVLDPTLIDVLCAEHPQTPMELTGAVPEANRLHTFREVMNAGRDVLHNLHILADDTDPIVLAVVLTVLAEFDLKAAREIGDNLRSQPDLARHWLLAEVLEWRTPSKTDESQHAAKMRIVLSPPGAEVQHLVVSKPYITIGSAADNDIVLDAALAAPYHLTIHQAADGVQLLRGTEGSVWLNGREVPTGATHVTLGSLVALAEDPVRGVSLALHWDVNEDDFVREPASTVTMFVWLARCKKLSRFGTVSIARLAAAAEVRRYRRESVIYREGDPAAEFFVLHSGMAAATSARSGGQDESVLRDKDGFGVLSTGLPYDATVRVISESATVVAIMPAARIMEVAGNDLDRSFKRAHSRIA